MPILTERKVWRKPRGPDYERPTGRATTLKIFQQANVLRAKEVLRLRFRTWAGLAEAMKVPLKVLSCVVTGRTKPHAGHAVRVARVAGVTTEEVLSGKFMRKGMCPMCGKAGALRG